MSIERQEELVRRLLEPLDRVEPVALVSNDRGRRRRRSLALALACVLAAGGLAAAAVPLSGFFSADHPRRAVDVLDPATAAMLKRDRASGATGGVMLVDESRLVEVLPAGRRVYLVPTSKGGLCVVVERLAESCGDPLEQKLPATFAVADSDRPGTGEGPVAYGVVRNGVASVSFAVDGHRETVPARRDVFAFQGRPTDRRFSAPTVAR